VEPWDFPLEEALVAPTPLGDSFFQFFHVEQDLLLHRVLPPFGFSDVFLRIRQAASHVSLA